MPGIFGDGATSTIEDPTYGIPIRNLYCYAHRKSGFVCADIRHRCDRPYNTLADGLVQQVVQELR